MHPWRRTWQAVSFCRLSCTWAQSRVNHLLTSLYFCHTYTEPLRPFWDRQKLQRDPWPWPFNRSLFCFMVTLVPKSKPTSIHHLTGLIFSPVIKAHWEHITIMWESSIANFPSLKMTPRIIGKKIYQILSFLLHLLQWSFGHKVVLYWPTLHYLKSHT